MRRIPLRDKLGKIKKWALVDDEWYEYLNQWRWCLDKSNAGRRYAVRGARYTTGKQYLIRMHRVVTNAPKGTDVDHVSHVCTDNRQKNLRLCSRTQNNGNLRLAKNNLSGFKGVCLHYTKKWRATISCEGKQIHIGLFKTAREAHKAYAKEAKKLFGKFAYPDKK